MKLLLNIILPLPIHIVDFIAVLSAKMSNFRGQLIASILESFILFLELLATIIQSRSKRLVPLNPVGTL